MSKLIVIVAPSGAGKSTLIQKIKMEFPQIVESVSCTTRTPREGERNGIHYNFISEQDFFSKKGKGDFLEWAKVHSNYYGTSKEFIEMSLKRGDYVLLDIDVQGADAVKEYFKDKAQAIFIAPPSIDELKKRLEGRATDSPEVISERVNNAKKELLKKDDYDYCVYNGDLEQAFFDLKKIIAGILDNK